jgi:ornithine carbamoyltransferase
MSEIRHFLTLTDFSSSELKALIQHAIDMKAQWKAGAANESLKNKTLAMIFEKSSTRTRVSFEAGMTQLGGHAMFLSPDSTQLGRGEPIEDTARVISRMVDVVMIRTFSQKTVETFAENSRVPVINALTDEYHPCQLLADVMTFIEHRGDIQGKTVTWIGDGNNMCHSWMKAALQFEFNLKVACPEGYEPDADILKETEKHVQVFHTTVEASKGSDLITTDVWASMGQEEEQKAREIAFADFQVDATVMQQAKDDALFMHCLPAHRGEEVTAEVIDGGQSVVWDEAENRLHAQKALLDVLVNGF